MVKRVTLAVAGSRKTQGLVDYCASSPPNRRILIVTFTQANQQEIRTRLAQYSGNHQCIVVAGWFSFLLKDFARPFLPFLFHGKRVMGFNFDGRPNRHANGLRRFLDTKDSVYACELARLSHELVQCTDGALIRRLECIYDDILIDEVQDLSSHDWEILDELINSSIDIYMVGDVRQSVLATSPRSAKNKKYGYAEAIHWFREREENGLLEIVEQFTTWRCHPGIADFSDTIFDSSWGFPKTESRNDVTTEHDGVFLVKPEHVDKYVAKFSPQCLRHSVASGKSFDLDYLNFKIAKGMTFKRVLIVPTAGIASFIKSAQPLGPIPGASFYVATTRAQQSVAIVIDDTSTSTIPLWTPHDQC